MKAIYFNIDKSKHIIYEIQSIASSDLIGMYVKTAQEKKIKTNMQALSHDRFYRVLPDKDISIHDLNDFFKNKINQAIMFLCNDMTKLYYPNSIIVSRQEEILIDSLDAKNLKEFYDKHNGNVVIKKNRSTLGKGNIFKKYESFREFLDTINQTIRTNTPFLISEVSMTKNKKDYTKYNLFETGNYERSLIICTEDNLYIYPIYREILDITDVTNSHDEKIKLKSKEYFDENQWPLEKNKEEDIEFYKNIAKVVMETTLQLNNKTFLKDENMINKIKGCFLSKTDYELWESVFHKNNDKFSRTNNLPKYFERKCTLQSSSFSSRKAFEYLLNESDADNNIDILIKKYPVRYYLMRNFLARLYFNMQNLSIENKEIVRGALDTLFQEGELCLERYNIFLSHIQKIFSVKFLSYLQKEEKLFIFNDQNNKEKSLIKVQLEKISQELNFIDKKFNLINENIYDKSLFIFLKRSKHEIEAAIKKERFFHIKSTLLFLLDKFQIKSPIENLVALVKALPDCNEISNTNKGLKSSRVYDDINQDKIIKKLKPNNMDCIINPVERPYIDKDTKNQISDSLFNSTLRGLFFSPLSSDYFDTQFNASNNDFS